MLNEQNYLYQIFLGSPVVKTSPSRVRGGSFIPDPGANIPHTSWPKNQNIKQKQYCNKFSKDFLKCPPQKKILKNKTIFLVYMSKEIVPNKTAPWSASLVKFYPDSLPLSVWFIHFLYLVNYMVTGSVTLLNTGEIAKLLVFLSCFLLYKRSRVMTCGGNSPLSAACLHAKQKVWRDIGGSLCQAGVKQEED